MPLSAPLLGRARDEGLEAESGLQGGAGGHPLLRAHAELSPAGRRPLALEGQSGPEADGGVTFQRKLQEASGLTGSIAFQSLRHFQASRSGARLCLPEALEACRGLGGAEDFERKGPRGQGWGQG